MILSVLILAAGKGTRMVSDLPKVAHKVAGVPMVCHVLRTAAEAGAQHTTVVLAPDAEGQQVQTLLPPDTPTAIQTERLGTGHAVQCATAGRVFTDADSVAVLYGDSPLLTAETLQKMQTALENTPDTAMVVLGFTPADAAQYGRLVIEGGTLQEIIEYAEATPAQRAFTLCNAGIMLFRGALLGELLAGLTNTNSKGEYYLTDTVALARAAGFRVAVTEAPEHEVLGVNSRVELAEAERLFQQRLRHRALVQGVTLTAPETVFLSADTVFGRDCIVEPFVHIGSGVRVGSRVTLRAFSHVEGAIIGDDSIVGPYARLRPGATLREGVHIGNFVEVKNSTLGKGSKANHLSYLGDAVIGSACNIGAGTITCNYDGYTKAATTLGDGVFVGSDTALIAPVTVGSGAVIAAGSTITDDVPTDALALSRSRQETRSGGGKRYHSKRQQTKGR